MKTTNTFFRPAAATLLLSALLSISTAATLFAAPPPNAPRFDHTIYVDITSEPVGAQIYAISVESNRVSEKIGPTPCKLVIGLTWDEKYGRKSWKDANLWTLGDCARLEMKEDKSYDIHLFCAAIKKGYYPEKIDRVIANLPSPGFGWDGADDWPTEVQLNVPLRIKEPIAAVRPPAAETFKPADTIPTVMTATGDNDEDETGTLVVRSSIGHGRLYVDDRYVGEVPIRIMLPAGDHDIEIRERGYKSARRQIQVTPNREQNTLLDLTRDLP